MRSSLARLIVLALAAAPSLHAQQLTGAEQWADSARREIDAAVRRADTTRLRGAIALIDRALTVLPDDPLLLHYKGYALYREATLARGRSRETTAELEAADDALERSASRLPLPETFAVRSAVVGQMIGSNPLTGMRLGPRANGLMDRARDLGPGNPRVWLLAGISAIFTPAMFGGGLDKAERQLRRAIGLFETDQPTPPGPSWGRAEAYVWLGQVMEKRRRIDDARAAYARAIALDPEFEWPKQLAAALERSQR